MPHTSVRLKYVFYSYNYIITVSKTQSNVGAISMGKRQSFWFNVPVLIFGSRANPKKFHGVEQANMALMYLHSFSDLHSLSPCQR